MPTVGSASFGAGGGKVTGGRQVYRFVDAAISGEHARALARAFARQFPLEQLRNSLPKRTGKLRRELRLDLRGGTVTLTAPFYGRFTGLEAEFLRLAQQTINRLRVDLAP